MPQPTPSSFQSPPGKLDTLATFYQILSVQSLHYLVLCIFIPPLLAILPLSPTSLTFEGGPAQIGMILDWRELSSRRTFDWTPLQGEDFLSWHKGWSKEVLLSGLDDGDRRAARLWSAGSVWLGDTDSETQSTPVVLPSQRIIRPHTRFLGGGSRTFNASMEDVDDFASHSPSGDSKAENDLESWEWAITRDPSRGWAIALAWLVTCAVDVFLLTTVVRRPKHILDHVATLHLAHLLLTSWYSSSIPTSLFWWTVMLAHGVVCIIWAERLAVKREMNVQVGWGLVGSGREAQEAQHGQRDAIPLSVIGAPIETETHVLFDEGDDEDEHTPMVSSAPPSMDSSKTTFVKGKS